jgi:hypothetical protein
MEKMQDDFEKERVQMRNEFEFEMLKRLEEERKKFVSEFSCLLENTQ